jgi:predicted AlkP superfamily pyrophosphatase or phosphodiesterase
LAIPVRGGEPNPRVEHVVLISIDGLRPDAIDKAGAKNLQALIQRGAWCPKAETIRPSITLPSHTSMITGLDYQRHGVTWNDYRPGHLQHPTVLSLAKQAGLSTAMYIGKDKLGYLAAPGAVDLLTGAAPAPHEMVTALDLAKDFEVSWPKQKFDLTFVHLADPDSAGHQYQWMSPAYLEAVRAADEAVGRMIKTVENTGVGESTMFIVTADHGGSGSSHADSTPENVTIPWICFGPGVKPGTVIERVVRVFDTAPTILKALRVAVPEGWDGHAVTEVLPLPAKAAGQSR